MFKRIAFTLAEVLIVLGIIGIIADMTIPTLKHDIDKIVYVTQMKKVYSSIYQAMTMTQAQEGVYNVAGSTAQCQETDSTKCFAASGVWLKTYFSVAADYGNKKPSCFAASYKTLNKQVFNGFESSYTVVLADGTCLGVNQGYDMWSIISVDTNGLKKPNIVGKDFFKFYLYEDGSLADIGPGGRSQVNLDKIASNCIATGYGCLTKLTLAGWKMDY